MDSTLVAALIGVAGILVGGGLQGAGNWWSQRKASKAVLSALVAEVEGLVRLIRHRQFYIGVLDIVDRARDAIEAGNPNAATPLFRFQMTGDYFRIYGANESRIGELNPYHADRIVRFYLLCQAVRENYIDGSQWMEGCTAVDALAVGLNDLQLLDVITIIGREIATFVARRPLEGSVSAMPTSQELPYPGPLPYVGVQTKALIAALNDTDGEAKDAMLHELQRRAARAQSLGLLPSSKSQEA